MPEDALTPDMRRWLAHLRTERRRSPHTLSNYERELRVLTAFLPPGGGLPDELDIRRQVAAASREGLAPRSIARRLSAWRSWADWLVLQGVVPANPFRLVRAPRAGRRLPKALTPDEAVRLAGFDVADAAKRREAARPRASVAVLHAEALRDKAIVELLYSSGLRLAELVGLDVRPVKDATHESLGWIDLDQAEVVVTGKGGKRRQAPVGAPALAALRAWLAVRPATGDAHALFLGARGGRIPPRSVQALVRRVAQEQGIPSRAHPHVLRHSFASHLLQSSGDLRAVQELLGHAGIATTQIYTSLDFQRLAAVYDSTHPRARRRSDTPDR